MGGCTDCPDNTVVSTVDKCESNTRHIVSLNALSLYSPSVVVDIATMQETFSAVELNRAFVINLGVIDISYVTFRDLFFSTNSEFTPNLQAAIASSNDFSKYILNKSQKVILESGDYRDFRIFNEMLVHYEENLGVTSDCWSSCSLTNFQNNIARQKTLFNVGDGCCIKCSLTLDEFFSAIEQQGVDMSGDAAPDSTGLRNLDEVIPKDTDKKPIAVVTALFASTTPGVPDVKVIWPYAVDFTNVSSRYTP